jgi:hypothetical protein
MSVGNNTGEVVSKAMMRPEGAVIDLPSSESDSDEES